MSPKTLLRLAFALLGVVLMAEIAAAADNSTDDSEIARAWEKWKNHYGTNAQYYATRDVGDARYRVFANNYRFIKDWNSDKSHSFSVGLNKFADLTTEEFLTAFTGYSRPSRAGRDVTEVPVRNVSFSLRDLPTTVDWRTQKILTPVKNQASCGSCWSFVATGAIEAQWALAGNPLISLSEQNLIDCSTSYGNNACNGGHMESAFKYVIANNGIESEDDYPYRTAGPYACSYSASQKAATILSYKQVAASESALAEAVASVGPVAVAIQATSSFQFYKSGVFYDSTCNNTMNHAVLAVGYGTEGGSDYWLVKNSWGTSWGMSGYGTMARNRNNNCGIATDASYPLVPGRSTSTTGYTSSGSSSGPSGSPSGSSSGSSSFTGTGSGSSSGSGSTTGGRASRTRTPSRSRSPKNRWCRVQC